MKIEEMRDLKVDELHLQLDQLRRHLFDLRAQAVTEKLENPNQLGFVRKDIARVLTIMHQRNERDIEAKQHHLEAVSAKIAKK